MGRSGADGRQGEDASASSRGDTAAVRAFAAHQRARAAAGRHAAAHLRDEAAHVRDRAATLRDEASLAREAALHAQQSAELLQLSNAPRPDGKDWLELLKLDREVLVRSSEAASRDREASKLDREASQKDREAAAQDAVAADADRLASDKDLEAAEAANGGKSGGRSEQLSTVGRVSAGIAHELNTPLTALQADLTVLETRHLDSAEDRELVGDLRRSLSRMAGVVEDLRGWVRVDSSESTRAPIALGALFDEAVALSADELRPRGVTVVKDEPLPQVWGVVPRLRHVFVRLLVHAAHAMPEVGQGNELRLRAFTEGSFVKIELHHNGAVIPAEVLPHLFDPFFTTREGQGGTALGLAVCEQVIIDHGGSLSVASAPGSGTTFRLTLPAGRELAVVGPRAADRRRPHVLLIDDDAALTRSLSRQLSSRCDVTVAANGQEGLEHLIAAGSRWDLVLCDLSMPVMNGRQLYEQILKRAPGLAAGIVFITGGALSRDTEDFLVALPNTKLFKPFTSDALAGLLEARVGSGAGQTEPRG